MCHSSTPGISIRALSRVVAVRVVDAAVTKIEHGVLLAPLLCCGDELCDLRAVLFVASISYRASEKMKHKLLTSFS